MLLPMEQMSMDDGPHTPPAPPPGLEPLLSIRDLAGYLGVGEQTIRNWRTKGVGPRAVVFSGTVRFRASDIRQWLEEMAEDKPSKKPVIDPKALDMGPGSGDQPG